MATDNFGDNFSSISDPANDAFSITPGSSALSIIPRALYIGGAGNVNLTTKGGTTLIFYSVPAGTILPIRVTHVLSTSTTATNIVGMQ